jgi:hypothetical protein
MRLRIYQGQGQGCFSPYRHYRVRIKGKKKEFSGIPFFAFENKKEPESIFGTLSGSVLKQSSMAGTPSEMNESNSS